MKSDRFSKMGNDNSKKLCNEYKQWVDISEARRRFGQEYITVICSSISGFKVYGNYHNLNVIQITLKKQPDEVFYTFIKKKDWNQREKDLTQICEKKSKMNIHIYTDTKFIIAIKKKNTIKVPIPESVPHTIPIISKDTMNNSNPQENPDNRETI